MKKFGKLGKGLFLLVLAGAGTLGVLSTSSHAALRPCGGGFECLDVWNPVICPNGHVYSNACYAAKACQTGCVAY